LVFTIREQSRVSGIGKHLRKRKREGLREGGAERLMEFFQVRGIATQFTRKGFL